jgi:predicted nucleic acid-binding protein
VDSIAPTMLISEVANVLPRRVRRGFATASTALEAYRLLKTNAPVIVDDHLSLDEATAPEVGGGYIAVALRRGCHLITADPRFHAAVSGRFPSVLHL